MSDAKEAGLSVEKVEFSPDGRYMVKTKNGENLMEPLSKLFEATLGSDPAIQAVYQTQAYINRKDYAVVNIEVLNRFDEGTEVTPALLIETGIVSNERSGIKILGNGSLEKKLTVKAHKFSGSAKEAIEAAGGQTEVV